MTIFNRCGLPAAAIGLLIGLAATAAGAASGFADNAYRVPITAKEQAFINTYISAINAHDWEKFKTLLSESSQACMTTDVPRYQDVMNLQIPDTHHIELIEKHIDMTAMPLAEHGMKLPPDVRHATHLMTLSFVDMAASKEGIVSNKMISEALLEVNDKYLLVLACPMTAAEKEAAKPKQ